MPVISFNALKRGGQQHVIIDGIGAYSGGFDAGGERRAANAPRWGYSGHPRDSKPRQILDFLRQRERYTPTIALLNPLFSTLNGAAAALIQKNPTQNNPDLVFFQITPVPLAGPVPINLANLCRAPIEIPNSTMGPHFPF